MYQGGSHIDATYEDHPEIEIVEYFRCSGFIWEPVSSLSSTAHLQKSKEAVLIFTVS